MSMVGGLVDAVELDWTWLRWSGCGAETGRFAEVVFSCNCIYLFCCPWVRGRVLLGRLYLARVKAWDVNVDVNRCDSE